MAGDPPPCQLRVGPGAESDVRPPWDTQDRKRIPHASNDDRPHAPPDVRIERVDPSLGDETDRLTVFGEPGPVAQAPRDPEGVVGRPRGDADSQRSIRRGRIDPVRGQPRVEHDAMPDAFAGGNRGAARKAMSDVRAIAGSRLTALLSRYGSLGLESSRPELHECLAVEPVRPGPLRTEPEHTLIVFVDGEQRNVSAVVLDCMSGHATTVTSKDTAPIGRHP